MWLVAGLGNPGSQYAMTRHNIGFLAIERLAAAGVNFQSKFQGECAKVSIGDEEVLLLKPQTFMNLSGQSVQAAMTFYKIPPSQLIVLQDEVDLPLGKLRIKKGGGANGHNGIKDIDARIGQEYWRIRLGVGRPSDARPTADYVLGRFTPEEQPFLDKTLAALSAHFSDFWKHSPEKLATAVAHTLNPPAPKPPKKDTTERPAQDKDSTDS